MKARVCSIKATVRLEASPASKVISELHAGDEIDLVKTVKKNDTIWVFVTLPTGKTGYVTADIKVYKFRNVVLEQAKVYVLNSPIAGSVTRKIYKKGDKFTLTGKTVLYNQKRWHEVRLDARVVGFIPAQTKIKVFKDIDTVKINNYALISPNKTIDTVVNSIKNTFRSNVIKCPKCGRKNNDNFWHCECGYDFKPELSQKLNDTQIGTQIEAQTQSKPADNIKDLNQVNLIEAGGKNISTKSDIAKQNMFRGFWLCIGGILVTVITYSMAAPTGGIFLIAWGPVIFGGIRFFKGLGQFISYNE
jgi:hypothetical protein